MKTKIILILITLIAFGCHQIDSGQVAYSTKEFDETVEMQSGFSVDDGLKEPPRSEEPVAPPVWTEQTLIKQSKIIKDGSITLEVDSLILAKQSIDSILKATGAYFENEVYNGGVNQHRYILKIRIPNSKFGSFISSLESGGGKMISKSINARDVTGEYIDLEIRHNNNQAYLNQYRALLKRAKTIKDILEIEEKARRIESEIDAQIGRMKYINDQVKYSTLTLNVYQKYIYKRDIIKEPRFLERVWESTKFGFGAMQEILLWMIALWPLLILLGFAYVGRRLFRGRRRKEIH